MERLNSRSVVGVAILIEAALFGLYLIWFYFFSRIPSFPLPQGAATLSRIVVYTSVLLAVNLTLFEWLAPQVRQLQQCVEFKKEYIVPLALLLRPQHAILVSIAAGVGEEFFFRGLLQTEIGIVLSSLVFAAVHFGPAIRKYLQVVSIYFAVSLYFAAIYEVTSDLWAVAGTHALYDLLVLLIIRRSENRAKRHT